MEFAIYRFRFPVGVHFGAGALWDGMNTLPADAFFSALCQEALALEGAAGIGALVSAVREGAFRLSDLFPFVGDELSLPKPLYPVSSEQEGDSIVKKSFKKLKYIPVSQWEAYLRGELDPVAEAEKFQRLGTYTLRSMAASRAPEKLESGDMLPYSVGVYQFLTGNGLYLIAGFGERGIQERFETLLRSLSYSGIGGKRSAGLGRFTAERTALPAVLGRKLGGWKTPCTTLSVCMAAPDELEAVVDGARYLLMKRSGFVVSETYAPELRKKKDFYSFCAGSCFQKRFPGDIYDVGGSGAHPVYRYAAALWMEM